MYPIQLLTVAIIEIVNRYANKDKRITHDEIVKYLQSDYSIEVDRKTVGRHISHLRKGGYVEGKRGVYPVNKFSNNEIRVLIDGILFSPSIPAEKAEKLIEKLKSLSQVSFENKMLHVHYVQDLSRTINDGLYETLDAIDDAIETNKKIRVTVCRYNEHAEIEDLWTEELDPYYIVNSNSRYYVICYAGRGKKLENRRIDRISHVEKLVESAEPIRNVIGKGKSFNLGEYMNEHIYMFSGESSRIRIKLLKQHIGILIEWYGSDYDIVERDGNYLTVRVKANENATYYWALQYGHLVEIVAPTSLREKMKQGLEEIAKKYE